MKLPEICVRHPVFAVVLSLLFLVVGLVALDRLDIRYFPSYQQPVAYINANYTGASADFMSNEITRRLEDSISGIDGIDKVSSTSQKGSSTITVTFSDNVDYYASINRLRNAIAGVQSKLPSGMENPPSVSDNSGANWNAVPTLNIGFSSTNMDLNALNRYLMEAVIPKLSDVKGVGSVPGPYGASSPALRVWLDPVKLSRFNLSASDVIQAIQSHNITTSSGSVEGPERSFTVISNTQLKTPADFANIILQINQRQPLRLKDVAKVVWGGADLYLSPLYVNGKQGLSLEIRPFTNANPIKVADDVLKRLKVIDKELPKGVTMKVTYNQATFIQSSLSESVKAVIEAIVLVSLVVFLFLGSLRLSLIPIVTIPICIIAVFGVMLLFGFTINVMTLLAIVLAIGLVVDDAIVIVENCHRHVHQGISPMQAAIDGSAELVFAIIAMTLILAVVYIPIGLSSGFTASIFREFAFTLAGSVLISGFIALTLSPMMSAYLLKPALGKDEREPVSVRLLNRLSTQYRRALIWVLQRGRWTLLFVLTLLISAAGVFAYLGSDLVPKEDIGYVDTSITLPPNVTQHYINTNMKQLDDILHVEPDIQYAMSFYLSSPTNFLTLVPWDKRHKDLDVMIRGLSHAINKKIPGMTVSINKPDPVDYGFGNASFQVNLMTLKENSVRLKQTSDAVVAQLKKYSGLTGVKSDLIYDKQQIELHVDQEQAALIGVGLSQISDSISVLLGGNHASDIDTVDGNRYPVQVQVERNYLQNFDVFQSIYVQSQTHPIPLSQLVSWTKTTGQASIGTYDKKRSAAITGTIVSGYTPSEVAQYTRKIIKKLLQPEQDMAFSGLIEQVQIAQQSALWLVVLAMVFIYLILSAQFESFLDPLLIMLTVPLSIAGALITIWISGNTLNVYTNIGMLTLIGLVTKHGILIVQFANQLVEEKQYSNYQAILESATIRLRPILMTTSAMVFGALPLALASGTGSVGRSAIGWVLVGGLSIGTIMSLFIVPSAYLWLANYRKNDVFRYFVKK